jgi:RNA polymerase sigma-70 factor (ECF subfamily)
MNVDITIAEMYDELHALAKNYMKGERSDHTLSASDLFHEAYSRLRPHLPLVDADFNALRSMFATTMRRVLIDHARKHIRRENRITRVTVPDEMLEHAIYLSDDEDPSRKLLELDEALKRLAECYPVHSQIVELRYFGGLTFEECASELGVPISIIQRRWKFARAWIAREISQIDCF